MGKMSFLLNYFRSGGKPSAATSSVVMTAESTKYAKWTHEQLVERIIELENSKRECDTLGAESKKRKSEDIIVGNGVQNGEEEKTMLEQTEKTRKEKGKKKKKLREFDFSKYNTRFIALRFAYLGWNYNGLAFQKEPTPLPTVEGTILEALNRCRLIPTLVPQDCNFSRCGRTDKGVSAMNQVISLNVRSNLTNEEQLDPANDSREIQYVTLLNQVLPNDIRISAVALRPPEGFDARFSCMARHYKYIFCKEGLNLDKMSEAVKLYEGEHDFRNFCRHDGSKQITNYNRTILSANILQITDDYYCFDLVGTAFLWHQVRCMMAILFLIGQELEEPSLVTEMLDVNKTPLKPIYEMASDFPLLLYDCIFPSDLEWSEANLEDFKAIKYQKSISAVKLNYEIKAAVAKIFKETLPSSNADFEDKTRINLGNGHGRVMTKYIKMLDRDTMMSVEEVNARYRNRKKGKSQAMNGSEVE